MTVAHAQLHPHVEAYAAAAAHTAESLVPVLEAFVVGSAAAGGFDPATSDLDLVLVVERPLAERRGELLERLRALGSPFRDVELVVYVAGSRPPDVELNVNAGEERPDEEPFWFVLDAALAQERAVPVLARHDWNDVFEPVEPERVREAMRASLAWAERQPPRDEFARLHAARARHYLEHGEWISKEEAAR